MKESVIVKKSFTVAVLAVKLAHKVQKEHKEFVVSRQFVRSTTSIGANIQEARGAQTDKDFFAKICIAYKEAREADYWLALLIASGLVNKADVSKLIELLKELMKMIGSTKMTLEKKLKK